MTETQFAVGTLTAIFVVTVVQSALLPKDPTRTPFKLSSSQQCEGVAIVVDYEYHGAQIGPHECQVQCDTQEQHYILYANNKGTQCARLPDCSDRGEDKGVTCKVPDESGNQDPTDPQEG